MNTRSQPYAASRWLIAALFFACIAFGLVSSVHAQSPAVPDPVAALAPAATGNGTADNIVLWLTPLLVPLLIAGVKKVLPDIPSWALPMIAPALGFLSGLITQLATGHSGNLWLSALLGLAGVGVREIKDQVKPAVPATATD